MRVSGSGPGPSPSLTPHQDGDDTEEKFGLEYGVTEFRDVLMPPHVIQGKSVCCAEIIRGDGMVPLDLSAAIGLGGIDPYVQLQFGNNEPVKSSYISGSREPVWQQQLEVPVVLGLANPNPNPNPKPRRAS